MRDVLYLEELGQAEALLKPKRVEVLRELAEPRSCTEVASRLELTPQRVYYHVRRLTDAGLVNQVAERRVRGIAEGIYQARARAYWMSPRLVGRIGERAKRDALSLGYLLELTEQVQDDVGRLATLDPAPELPSFGLSGEIRVPPERRPEFLRELTGALRELFTRYGGGGDVPGEAFSLAVACYPKGPLDDRDT